MYSLVDIAQHALTHMCSSPCPPTAHWLNARAALQRVAGIVGTQTPPQLAIYLLAIQSICNNGCSYKILLPQSFSATLAAAALSSAAASSQSSPSPPVLAASSIVNADSPVEIIQFFCDLLLGSTTLARCMTPRAQRECTHF